MSALVYFICIALKCTTARSRGWMNVELDDLDDFDLDETFSSQCKMPGEKYLLLTL